MTLAPCERSSSTAAPTSDWIPAAPPLPEPDGYAALVRSWLRTFGPGTLAAVKSFQHAHGLTEHLTGVVPAEDYLRLLQLSGAVPLSSRLLPPPATPMFRKPSASPLLWSQGWI